MLVCCCCLYQRNVSDQSVNFWFHCWIEPTSNPSAALLLMTRLIEVSTGKIDLTYLRRQHTRAANLPAAPFPISFFSQMVAQVTPRHVLHNKPHPPFYVACSLELFPASSWLIPNHGEAAVAVHMAPLVST
jgi:hypothetical protein